MHLPKVVEMIEILALRVQQYYAMVVDQHLGIFMKWKEVVDQALGYKKYSILMPSPTLRKQSSFFTIIEELCR